MKLKQIDVVTTEIETSAQPISGGGMTAQIRPTTAVSCRFEITGDEILLLGMKEEDALDLGRRLAKALLAFAQVEEIHWEIPAEPRQLDS